MSSVKPYVIIAVLVGTGILIYALAFLSAKVVPENEISSGQLMIAITETIAGVALCIAAVLGSMFYFTKKRFEQISERH
jgi:uncharacterized membrane protein